MYHEPTATEVWDLFRRGMLPGRHFPDALRRLGGWTDGSVALMGAAVQRGNPDRAPWRASWLRTGRLQTCRTGYRRADRSRAYRRLATTMAGLVSTGASAEPARRWLHASLSGCPPEVVIRGWGSRCNCASLQVALLDEAEAFGIDRLAILNAWLRPEADHPLRFQDREDLLRRCASMWDDLTEASRLRLVQLCAMRESGDERINLTCIVAALPAQRRSEVVARVLRAASTTGANVPSLWIRSWSLHESAQEQIQMLSVGEQLIGLDAVIQELRDLVHPSGAAAPLEGEDFQPFRDWIATRLHRLSPEGSLPGLVLGAALRLPEVRFIVGAAIEHVIRHQREIGEIALGLRFATEANLLDDQVRQHAVALARDALSDRQDVATTPRLRFPRRNSPSDLWRTVARALAPEEQTPG